MCTIIHNKTSLKYINVQIAIQKEQLWSTTYLIKYAKLSLKFSELLENDTANKSIKNKIDK